MAAGQRLHLGGGWGAFGGRVDGVDGTLATTRVASPPPAWETSLTRAATDQTATDCDRHHHMFAAQVEHDHPCGARVCLKHMLFRRSTSRYFPAYGSITVSSRWPALRLV